MNITSEKENIAEKAGAKLTHLLSQHKEKPVLLMLSGGSAFQMLEHVDIEKLPHDLTIAVLDERYDTRGDVNNFHILSETLLFKAAIKNGAQNINTFVLDDELHEVHAKRFEESLRTWKKANPNGVIVATMGMGPDGHIAGIMPFPDDGKEFKRLFENEDVWVTPYDAGEKNEFPLRTTTTNSFLRNEIDHTIMYVSGEAKRDLLQNVYKGRGSLHEYPARIMHEMKDLTLVTDIDITQT